MRSPQALAGWIGLALLLAIACASPASGGDPAMSRGGRGSPTMAHEGRGSRPLELPYRPDALWVQSPNLDGLIGSSEVIGRYGVVSELANDFVLAQPSVIENITWWGGYYNYLPGDPLVTGFNLFLYTEGRYCFPGNQILELIIPNNCNETFVYDQFGYPIYEYSVDVPPIAIPGGVKRWLGVQAADHPFPPQWGRLEAAGGVRECDTMFRSVFFSYPDWRPPSDIYVPYDASFALYGHAAEAGEACCFSDGSCMSVSSETCAASGGTPQGPGSACDPNPCAAIDLRACCFGDGTCRVLAPDDCFAEEGASLPDEEYCSQDPCPEPQGCCLPDGSCRLLIVEACLAHEGIPQGNGTDCSNPCAGRCCFTMGTCRLLDADACALAGGSFSLGTTCLPNPCPPPETPRACCFGDHECTVLSVEDCLRDGGEPRLPGTACDPSPCVPEGVLHACCFGDGGCRLLLQDACIEGGGLPLGACTICEPNPCPDPPWACCLADGTCIAVTAVECAEQDGQWFAGLVCEGAPCLGIQTLEVTWGRIKAMYR